MVWNGADDFEAWAELTDPQELEAGMKTESKGQGIRPVAERVSPEANRDDRDEYLRRHWALGAGRKNEDFAGSKASGRPAGWLRVIGVGELALGPGVEPNSSFFRPGPTWKAESLTQPVDPCLRWRVRMIWEA